MCGIVACYSRRGPVSQDTLERATRSLYHRYVQDTLRSPAMAAMPFLDRKEVVALLDRLPAMDTGERVANDQVLMLLASMCVLQERYKPSAASGAATA